MLEEKSEPPGDLYSRNKIPILSLIPKTSKSKVHLQNGLSKYFNRLRLKVSSQIEECFLIWNKFSKNQSLFDLWDFRYSWFEAYRYTPYFYTIYEESFPLACLPLWYDREKQRYEWFGSNWMEDNYFFTKDQRLVDFLLMIAPKPIWLNAIDHFIDSPEFKTDDAKFVTQIKKIDNIDQYLARLQKKYRYNLKRDYLSILDYYNPRIEIIEKPDFCQFENIIKLSKKRFNGTLKKETDLARTGRIKAYANILKNSGLYRVKFIKVFIQGYLAAIDLIITYKDRYYTLKGANDIERFPGIGNFMVYFEMEDAIRSQFSFVDCLQFDYGWKHKYFEEKKLYVFERR
jgi:hypothetical protein